MNGWDATNYLVHISMIRPAWVGLTSHARTWRLEREGDVPTPFLQAYPSSSNSWVVAQYQHSDLLTTFYKTSEVIRLPLYLFYLFFIYFAFRKPHGTGTRVRLRSGAVSLMRKNYGSPTGSVSARPVGWTLNVGKAWRECMHSTRHDVHAIKHFNLEISSGTCSLAYMLAFWRTQIKSRKTVRDTWHSEERRLSRAGALLASCQKQAWQHDACQYDAAEMLRRQRRERPKKKKKGGGTYRHAIHVYL